MSFRIPLGIALVVVIGCGRGSASVSGLPTPDETSGDDKNTPDDPTADRVTVNVVDQFGAPYAQTEVLFHDNDGVLIDRVKASADGVARCELPEGGMVSVFELDPDSPRMQSYFGLAAGDALTVTRERPVKTKTIHVTVPYFAATSFDVRLYVTCGARVDSDKAEFDVRVPESCANTTLLAIGYAHEWRPAFFSVTTADLSQVTEVELGNWSADFSVVQVALSNVPDDVRFVRTEMAVWVDGFETHPATFDSRFLHEGLGGEFVMQTPTGLGDASAVSIFLNGGGGDGRVVTTGLDAVETDLTIALPELLSEFERAELDASQPERAALTWEYAQAQTTPDMIHGVVAFPVSEGHAGTWSIAAPESTREVRFPELPEDLGALVPRDAFYYMVSAREFDYAATYVEAVSAATKRPLLFTEQSAYLARRAEH